MLTWSDMCGVTGVAVSTTCYACVQWRRDFAKSIHYSLLNLVATGLFGTLRPSSTTACGA